MKKSISYEVVTSLLDYDPLNGIITWKANRPRGVKIGDVAGSIWKSGYRYITIMGNVYLAHRLAWFMYYKKWPNVIDHINGNRSDNRIANLRSGTMRDNSHNSIKTRNGGIAGVWFNKECQKWQAQFAIGKSRYYLGLFETEELAAQAYNKTLELYAAGIHPTRIVKHGCTFNKRCGLWHAYINHGNKRYSLGYYKTYNEGHAKYLEELAKIDMEEK